MRKLLLIPLLLIGLLVLLPGAAFAQEKEWHFADWQVDIDINEDSSFHVKETHTYDFVGDFSWVTRDLVKQGEMTISNIRVFDGDTGEELFSPDIQITPGYYSDLVTINFNLSNVQKKYIIEYDVFNAIGYFDTWDELYWNAVSDDRDVAIDQVDVWVNLPVAVDPAQLSGRLLIGAYGTSEEANTWDVNDQGTFHFWGKNIEAYENFTIVAGWPKDIVPEPDLLKITSNPDTADININGHDSYYNTPMQFYVGDMIEYGENVIEVSKFGYEKQANKIIVEKGGGVYFADFQLEETLWYQIGIVLIVVLLGLYIASPMLVLVLLLRKWLKIGRDPKGRGTIIPQYETYNELTPGLVGTIYDFKADLKDITSTIIDLAVRGYIKIIESDKKTFTLEKLKEADGKLLDYEKEIFNNIFTGNEKIKKLESLKNKFYTHIPDIREKMYNNLVKDNYFVTDPSKIRKKYNTWGIALISIGFFTMFIYGIGAVIFAYGILFFIFAPLMPARTKKGVEAREWLEGYEMYLHHAERFRLKKMTAEHFEECLPYAMVFGVEKEWAKQFEDIYKQSPDWYQGSSTMGTWSVLAFTSSLSSSFNSAAATTMNSRPGSSGSGGSGFSGSSGFSGGGFSGGGFGGGGSSAG